MQPKSLLLPALCGAASAAVHNVEVGNGGLTFKPDTVSANVGDTVVFQFFPQHNVVQGDFASPCTPSGQGFYSGSYAQTNSGQLRFVVNVTSTDPIYYYCSVQRHCQNGMVGAINPPTSGNTISAYKSASGNVAGQAVTPTESRGGQLLSADQLNSSTLVSSSASSSSTSTRSAASGTSAASSASAAATSKAGAAIDTVPGATNGLVALFIGIIAWAL